MLGKVRRTTRIDVGLSISMIGVAYLVWAVAVGVGRHGANELAVAVGISNGGLPTLSSWMRGAFLHGGPIWDVLGVAWLVVGLTLVVGASRQAWSVSWAWLSGICQAMAAALVACWVALAAQKPHGLMLTLATERSVPLAGWTSLSISVAVALVIWTTVLVWLLIDRARLGRGPSLRDSLRTHR